MLATSTRPRIYVASLADYNNGVLHGRWIDVGDADEMREEIAAMLRESHYPNVMVDCPAQALCPFGTLTDGTRSPCPTCNGTGQVPSAEEFAIHDYEGFEHLDEYESIDTVAALGEAIEEYGEAFGLYWAYETRDDIESALEEFRDSYHGCYASERAFAEEFLDETGELDQIPEHLRFFFDYDAYARDLFIDSCYSIDGREGVHVFCR